MSPEDTQLVRCLYLVQEFETSWAYILLSDGTIDSQSAKAILEQLVALLHELSGTDDRLSALLKGERKVTYGLLPSPKQRGLANSSQAESTAHAASSNAEVDVHEVIEQLRFWIDGQVAFPCRTPRRARILVGVTLTAIKNHLTSRLRLESLPQRAISSGEANLNWWKGHLPSSLFLENISEIIHSASSNVSIAVMGDIRKSQELMTYAESPEQFSRHMLEFIKLTRKLADKHFGLFDKFTGDGFLVYFSEAICQSCGADFVGEFLSFAEELLSSCGQLFERWLSTVRKLPAEPVGLALGADVGTIKFFLPDNHLVAVGDTIVWASRMSAAANAGQLYVNNRLIERVKEFARETSKKHLTWSDRPCRTKSGEGFLARELQFHNHA